MRANTGLIMPTTTTLLVKVQDLQQKLQLGGNQKSPESIRSLVGEPQQVSQVSGLAVTILTPSKTILQLE